MKCRNLDYKKNETFAVLLQYQKQTNAQDMNYRIHPNYFELTSDADLINIVKKNAAIGDGYRTAESIAIGMAAIRECIKRGI